LHGGCDPRPGHRRAGDRVPVDTVCISNLLWVGPHALGSAIRACGQDSAVVPSARAGRYWKGRLGGLANAPPKPWGAGLWSRVSTSSLATGPDSLCEKPGPDYVQGGDPPSGIGRARAVVRSVQAGGAIGSQGHARARVVSCRPPEGVVVQQRRGLAAWRWQTRRGTRRRTDAAARDARFCRCPVPARGDRRSGVGSPLPCSTGDGHRGAGAGPRVTADEERPVGQFAASAPPTRRRRHLTTISVRSMAGNLLAV
jgi:hypothetical protein